jgi:hypothetical protein
MLCHTLQEEHVLNSLLQQCINATLLTRNDMRIAVITLEARQMFEPGAQSWASTILKGIQYACQQKDTFAPLGTSSLSSFIRS